MSLASSTVMVHVLEHLCHERLLPLRQVKQMTKHPNDVRETLKNVFLRGSHGYRPTRGEGL